MSRWFASYNDKRACNKRTGPGGGTRRVKMLAFVRMGIVKCPITVIANDNSTEEFALAA